MNKKKSAVSRMTELAASLKAQGVTRSSVHHVLLERSFSIVMRSYPQYAEILTPMLKYMLHVVKKPDKKTDYENGLGRHYYSSLNYTGVSVSPIKGYYRSGTGRFGKSARTMLEEDYTMALTMYKSGFTAQASSYLGRAVHMLSDICCLPHALCMTYFSPARSIHQSYEKLASYLYPEQVPEKDAPIAALSFFSDRYSFSASLNSIAEGIRYELHLLYSDPKREIIIRLYDTEIKVAALLVRFCEDISLPSEKAHYITDGMRCPLFGGSDVKVTEKGLLLMHRDNVVTAKYTDKKSCTYFSAAHRRNGYFTLSPARCSGDKVFTDKGAVPFAPRKSEQFFRFGRSRRNNSK